MELNKMFKTGKLGRFLFRKPLNMAVTQTTLMMRIESNKSIGESIFQQLKKAKSNRNHQSGSAA